MDTKKTLFTVGGIALAAGVGTLLYQQYKLTEKLCYSAGSFRILRFGMDSSTIEVNVHIENKGDLEMDIRRMNFDVYANDIYIANVTQYINAPIVPNGKADLPVQVTFNPKDVLKNLKDILGQSSLDTVQWRFKGSITVKKWGIPFPIPFRLRYSTYELRTPSADSVCGK